MNKVTLTISIIALLGVILLTISRNNPETVENKKENPTETSYTDTVKTGNIAYVNIDSLVDSYSLYNELQTALMDKQARLSKEQESKMLSLQRKERELQQKVQERMMTQTTAQEQMQKLLALQQQYVQEGQMLELQLSEENQNITRQVYDSIYTYLKKYNVNKKYDLILSSAVVGGTVLLAKDGMDITGAVIKGMNAGYLSSGNIGK